MIYKRGRVWWTHFGHDGKDFRQSLRTSDWQEAKKKEKQLIADVESGRLQAANDSFAGVPFDLALERYRNERKPYLSPTTTRAELDHSQPRKKFFGTVRLRESQRRRFTITSMRGRVQEKHGRQSTRN